MRRQNPAFIGSNSFDPRLTETITRWDPKAVYYLPLNDSKIYKVQA